MRLSPSIVDTSSFSLFPHKSANTKLVLVSVGNVFRVDLPASVPASLPRPLQYYLEFFFISTISFVSTPTAVFFQKEESPHLIFFTNIGMLTQYHKIKQSGSHYPSVIQILFPSFLPVSSHSSPCWPSYRQHVLPYPAGWREDSSDFVQIHYTVFPSSFSLCGKRFLVFSLFSAYNVSTSSSACGPPRWLFAHDLADILHLPIASHIRLWVC